MPAYEISNHAGPGQESRHNLVYWRYGDYVGIGPGAHGRLTLDGGQAGHAHARACPSAGWPRSERGHGEEPREAYRAARAGDGAADDGPAPGRGRPDRADRAGGGRPLRRPSTQRRSTSRSAAGWLQLQRRSARGHRPGRQRLDACCAAWSEHLSARRLAALHADDDFPSIAADARAALASCVLFLLPLLVSVGFIVSARADHWSRARWDSTGLAPDPDAHPEAVVQVYAARTWGWKGAVRGPFLDRVQAGGCRQLRPLRGGRLGRGPGRAGRAPQPAPAGRALGRQRSDAAGRAARRPRPRAIPKLEDAIARYPYPDSYVTWPGPNSNTFVAWLAREVPELRVTLPPTAIGKDFLPGGQLAALRRPAAPASALLRRPARHHPRPWRKVWS